MTLTQGNSLGIDGSFWFGIAIDKVIDRVHAGLPVHSLWSFNDRVFIIIVIRAM